MIFTCKRCNKWVFKKNRVIHEAGCWQWEYKRSLIGLFMFPLTIGAAPFGVPMVWLTEKLKGKAKKRLVSRGTVLSP